MIPSRLAAAYRALHFINKRTVVERPSGTWWCSCEDFRIRRDHAMQTCKHIRMARMAQGGTQELTEALIAGGKGADFAATVAAVDKWIDGWKANKANKKAPGKRPAPKKPR